MTAPLIIYHQDCPDGFCSAVIAKKALPAAELRPYHFEKALPLETELAGRDVYILDFSFNQEGMQYLVNASDKVIILDHHISAVERIGHFCQSCAPSKMFSRFDMKKSGAMLTWDYFYPQTPPPKLVRMVQARDIYTWDEPDAKSLLALVDMWGYDLNNWTKLLDFSDQEWGCFVEQGQAICNKLDALTESLVLKASDIVLNGVSGKAVNNSIKEISNEIGVALAKVHSTFGLVWYVQGDLVKCSLRSEGDFSVEKLARLYGGGGHKNAAAFTVKIDQIPTLLAGKL